MSIRASRIFLIIEAIVIIAPLTLVALAVSVFFISGVVDYPNLVDVIALAFLAIIGLISFTSVWRLFAAFLHGGTAELRSQHLFWWIMVLAGLLILVGSLISYSLPGSPEYSTWSSFRFEFNGFVICTPMLIPLCHLASERLLRRAKS